MPAQTANIIDFQAYRQSRSKPAHSTSTSATPVSFAMRPVLMWVPYWGFFPVMAVGVAGYDA